MVVDDSPALWSMRHENGPHLQKEPVMLIVDSQVHIWTSGIPTNPAHRQISSFTKDDLAQRNG